MSPILRLKTPGLAHFYDAAARFVLAGDRAHPAARGNTLTHSPWRAVPGGAHGPDPRDSSASHVVAKKWLSTGGARRIVAGWCAEHVDRQVSGHMTLLLAHHSLIEQTGGNWLCPSTPAGTVLEFFEDAGRAFEADRPWNMLMVSNRPTFRIDAFTPAWYTQVGRLSLLSTDRRHARWVKFSEQNPFEFVRAQGGDARSLVDMAFMSDVNRLIEATPELREAKLFELSAHEQAGVLHELEQAWLIANDAEGDLLETDLQTDQAAPVI